MLKYNSDKIFKLECKILMGMLSAFVNKWINILMNKFERKFIRYIRLHLNMIKIVISMTFIMYSAENLCIVSSKIIRLNLQIFNINIQRLLG